MCKGLLDSFLCKLLVLHDRSFSYIRRAWVLLNTDLILKVPKFSQIGECLRDLCLLLFQSYLESNLGSSSGGIYTHLEALHPSSGVFISKNSNHISSLLLSILFNHFHVHINSINMSQAFLALLFGSFVPILVLFGSFQLLAILIGSNAFFLAFVRFM